MSYWKYSLYSFWKMLPIYAFGRGAYDSGFVVGLGMMIFFAVPVHGFPVAYRFAKRKLASSAE